MSLDEVLAKHKLARKKADEDDDDEGEEDEDDDEEGAPPDSGRGEESDDDKPFAAAAVGSKRGRVHFEHHEDAEPAHWEEPAERAEADAHEASLDLEAAGTSAVPVEHGSATPHDDADDAGTDAHARRGAGHAGSAVKRFRLKLGAGGRSNDALPAPP